MRASQTLLNTADICLRRAGYSLDPALRGPGSEATAVGSAYHAGMEAYYRWRQQAQVAQERPENWPHPPDEVWEAVVADAHRRLVEALGAPALPIETSPEECWARTLTMMQAYFSSGLPWPADVEVLDVEAELWAPPRDDDWQLGGILDLAVRLPDGRVILDDHKTSGKGWRKGKESPRQTSQPGLYAHLWRLATGALPAGFSFSIVRPTGQVERRFVEVTDRTVDLALTKLESVLPLLSGHLAGTVVLPGSTTSPLCSERFCDYWFVCPLGADE